MGSPPGRCFLNVIHLLLLPARAVGLFEQLLEAHFIEHFIGGGGELVVDQVHGNLAGGELFGGAVGLRREPAFESADDLADADLPGARARR